MTDERRSGDLMIMEEVKQARREVIEMIQSVREELMERMNISHRENREWKSEHEAGIHRETYKLIQDHDKVHAMDSKEHGEMRSDIRTGKWIVGTIVGTLTLAGGKAWDWIVSLFRVNP